MDGLFAADAVGDAVADAGALPPEDAREDDTTDAGPRDSGLHPNEADTADTQGTDCSSILDAPRSCEWLEEQIDAEIAASKQCSADNQCGVIRDPYCIDDGGGYPLAVTGTTGRMGCLVDQFFEQGCEGVYCDWWGPIPKGVCTEGGTCAWVDVSCNDDSDCAATETCGPEEPGLQGGECLPCVVGAGTYQPWPPFQAEGCDIGPFVVAQWGDDPCGFEVTFSNSHGTCVIQGTGRADMEVECETTGCTVRHFASDETFYVKCPDCSVSYEKP